MSPTLCIKVPRNNTISHHSIPGSIYTVAPIKHSYHGDYPRSHFQKTTRLSASPLLLHACGDISPTNHVMRLKFHLLAEELQTRKFIKSRQAPAVAKVIKNSGAKRKLLIAL
ncbi:hypothetical protein CDAR_101731 [Caerostris darwini]|uniref:Uncharacterized protein n=1 Tax=Caerostris darwini TaxID=1538125 RepID=A0AAV4S715_9ARAC|nr:hypothetical protein CDAR_101731 [Caerostris darwini]